MVHDFTHLSQNILHGVNKMKLGILIYFIVISAVGLLISAHEHGKSKFKKINFFVILINQIIGFWLPILLLYFYC